MVSHFLTNLITGVLFSSSVLIIVSTYLYMKQVIDLKLFKTCFLFGKFANVKDQSILTLPKYYFWHFYACSILCTLISMFSFKLDEKCIYVLCITFLNSLRRIFECLFVNVKSNAKMSIFHYFAGLGFYSVLPVAIILDCQDINLNSVPFNWIAFLIYTIIISLIQLLAHISIYQLAATRLKNSFDFKNPYLAPCGYMFKHLSCPHYLLEITFYSLIFWIIANFNYNSYFFRIWSFVIINQICSILMTHKWYCENLPNWAKSRYMFVPKIL